MGPSGEQPAVVARASRRRPHADRVAGQGEEAREGAASGVPVAAVASIGARVVVNDPYERRDIDLLSHRPLQSPIRSTAGQGVIHFLGIRRADLTSPYVRIHVIFSLSPYAYVF